MIAPPAVTTKRLLTPVIATSPTFWAKALCVKPLNSGARNEAPMSARRPSAIRRRSTSLSTISPTAMMSAVVSVRITMTTISIEMMEAISNTGGPNASGVGRARNGPERMSPKSAWPVNAARTVPSTMPSRIESREIAALPSLDSSRMMSRVAKPSPMLPSDA